MLSKTAVAIISLAFAVSAAPNAKRATCSNGRTASDSKCCVWFDILDDIQSPDGLFGGQCVEETHESLRLTFHDAISYSLQEGFFGGADGSIMEHADIELQDFGNHGLDEIVMSQRDIADKYRVPYGDFIQFAGAVGVSNCMGGPRLRFFAGRPFHSQPAPGGFLPSPAAPVDVTLARMADAGFSPEELVDLLASHSVAAQDGVDPSIPGTPLDSTPSEFDSQFFVETLMVGNDWPGNGNHSGENESPYPGEFRLTSDYRFARDPRTACEWQVFITDHDLMVQRFEAAMQKLSLLGQDPNTLTDCSDVIPQPRRARSQVATIPAGRSNDDIEWSCPSLPTPSLSVDPGPETPLVRLTKGRS